MNIRYLHLLPCLLFFLASNTLFAQVYNQVLTPAQLQEDLRIFRYNLETVQPGLYTYTSKEEMDKTFDNIKKGLHHPMTDIDFYRLLTPLHQKIKNGHTMIFPSENWDEFKGAELPLFPFDIYWNNNRLFILKNLSKNELIPLGTEITTINGELATDVFNQLVDNWTSDGDNRTFPAYFMALDLANWYANFKGCPKQYQLQLVKPDGNIYEVEVEALKNVELDAIYLKRYQSKRIPWYLQEKEERISLNIDQEIGILKVPTFDRSSKGINGKRYKRYYKEAFGRIKAAGIKHLILDLRDNGGGDPMPQLALISHLFDQPMELYNRTYAITRKIPNGKLYEENISFINLLAKLALKKRGDIYEEDGGLIARLKGAPPKKPTQAAKSAYTNKLYVLINGASFSATGEVAGILKNHDRAVFIGEETGGNPNQNTSGIMPMLHLPNSNIRIRLGLLCFENKVNFKNDRHGVRPHYYVRNSIDDVLAGRDAVMEFTLNLIKK